MSTITQGADVYGSTLTSTMTCVFFASALLVFFYLWKKGQLDMDEEAKYQMMKEDHDEKTR